MGKLCEDAFLDLLRAGLWEHEVQLLPYGELDFEAIMQLAEEQSVVGLVAAGIEHVVDGRPAKKDVMQFIGRTVQMEQRNQAMNDFIGGLVDKMRVEGIEAVLVKGQGVAQCYERPLWRACGDVDFFLDAKNYERAKGLLTPFASSVEEEYVREKHQGINIDSWVIELHGSLYSGLSSRIERELDEVYRETFESVGEKRFWYNGDKKVRLLSMENDVFYVFTHILQHFYKGGIGLRQICDWCRLLFRYRRELDLAKLEHKLRRAGLMNEWNAFGTFAVRYLGLPDEAIPFYDVSSFKEEKRWRRKAEHIKKFIMMSGNMGHNRNHSYFEKYPYLVRKCISLAYRVGDMINHARIFPIDSLRFFPKMLVNGVSSVVRGE